jgi:hypothetical protein
MNHLYANCLYYQSHLSSFEEYNTIFLVMAERLKGYHCVFLYFFEWNFLLTIFEDLFLLFSKEDNSML